MRLKRSFCGYDKTDRHCQDNDGSQKEDFVEGHRHRHRFDRDVGAADKNVDKTIQKDPIAVFLYLHPRDKEIYRGPQRFLNF